MALAVNTSMVHCIRESHANLASAEARRNLMRAADSGGVGWPNVFHIRQPLRMGRDSHLSVDSSLLEKAVQFRRAQLCKWQL